MIDGPSVHGNIKSSGEFQAVKSKTVLFTPALIICSWYWNLLFK